MVLARSPHHRTTAPTAPYLAHSFGSATIHTSRTGTETSCGRTITKQWVVEPFRPSDVGRCRACSKRTYAVVYLPVPTTHPQSSGWLDWISNAFETEAFPVQREHTRRLIG